jgi:uncharacterized protein (TIGR00290 family)
MKKVSISWSGGKDSAFALFKINSDRRYDVVSLHTLVDLSTRRVGLHGVREEIIEQQAKSIGVPLIKLYTSSNNEISNYERVLKTFYQECITERVSCVAFGDIFLEDLRKYREQLLSDSNLNALFPLWKKDTQSLYAEFVGLGFKAAICSANANMISKQLLGMTLDRTIPKSLNQGVDVCGENGEYHTLVYDGPIFKHPLEVDRGSVVKKWYKYKTKNHNGEIETQKTPFFFQDFFLRNSS